MGRERESKLATKLSELKVAEAKAGVAASGVNEVRMRIVWAAERYADLAESVARNLTEAVSRIRQTEDFIEPRSATGWCGGLEDLMRLRGEIDALTSALEIAEHVEKAAKPRCAETLNALKVLTLDPKISAWLRANDPKALEQATTAIGNAG